jgi:hypothetical protein
MVEKANYNYEHISDQLLGSREILPDLIKLGEHTSTVRNYLKIRTFASFVSLNHL